MGKRKFHVDSFPPEYVTLWKAATTRAIEFTMPYHKAVRARQELYNLRVALAQAMHPLADFITPLSITLDPPLPGKDNEVPTVLRVGKKIQYDFLASVRTVLASEIAAETAQLSELDAIALELNKAQLEANLAAQESADDDDTSNSDYDSMFPLDD